MLYTCADDFFCHAAEMKHLGTLTREEEKAYAKRMAEGDAQAKERLYCNYLPLVAACIKRWYPSAPSLELIYRGISVLEESLQTHHFQNDRETFTHVLSNRLRQMAVRYIADRSM